MIIFISLVVIVIDIVAKLLVSNNLILNNSITIIPNFFYLTYAHNYGGAWSIFDNSTLFIYGSNECVKVTNNNMYT